VDGASCGLVGMDLVGVRLEHCAGYGGKTRRDAALRSVGTRRVRRTAPNRIDGKGSSCSIQLPRSATGEM
jgi:hypothetical protein